MENNSRAGQTIRYVIMSTLNRLGQYSMHNYRRMAQMAIECVKEEIRMYHAASIEVYKTKVGDAGIVTLPPDAEDWIKVGFEINGQIFNLAVNDNMVLNRATKCGEDLRKVIQGGLRVFSPVDGYYYGDYFNNDGGYVTAMYGLGGGWTSVVYRYDRTMRRFQFDGPVIGREIYIEYKSTGIKQGTILEPELIAPIRNFIIWQMIENDQRVPMNEKERKKEQYENSIEKLRDFRSKFTMREFLDTKYRTLTQSIKR